MNKSILNNDNNPYLPSPNAPNNNQNNENENENENESSPIPTYKPYKSEENNEENNTKHLTDNELMEIENGKNSESEYKSEQTYEYKGNNYTDGTQNQIDTEMEMEMETDTNNSHISHHIDKQPNHGYLMSAQSEENYIKNMIHQAVVIGTNSSTISARSRNINDSNVELITIIDENDSIICDNDTIKNLPTLPVPSNTMYQSYENETNSNMSNVESLKDEESITMLEVGYEWITLVLLEIDVEHWREYVDRFKQHNITENRLIDLGNDDLKILIPNKITRQKFEKLLENKLNLYHD